MALTTEQFIEKARQIHGDKYDYSKVEYVNNRTKVCIICSEHGEFWQEPHNHLKGRGCIKCGINKASNNRKKTKEIFIEKAKKTHGNKYDYSKVKYVNAKTKVCIICPEHGEFWQTPDKHLSGCGCQSCGGVKRLTKEDFINKAIKIHGNIYDYSKVNYTNINTKVCIICSEHGEFWQKPYNHLYCKCGCTKCSGQYMDREYFIECANKTHNNKYNYSKVEYVNNKTKVCIICPEHGEFWQTPHNHLKGKGCPICSESKLEKKVRNFLIENKIKFETEKTFEWLKNEGQLRLDFYLPDYNIAIECQGEQHFKPIDFAGKGIEWAKKILKENKKRDLIKRKLCKEHNIKIIYIPYD